MKKNIILTILSIILGLLLTLFMFKQYDSNPNFVLVNANINKYYFIGLGIYDTYDTMISNTNRLKEFIYTKEDNYYVFGCITKTKENIEKIEGNFKERGYITYIREYNLSNQNLNKEITSIDLLLSNTFDSKSINELCKQTLITYKEG